MYHSASTLIGLIILSLCLWKHCWASIEESDDFLLNTFDQDLNSQELLESNDTNNLELGPDLDNGDGKFTYLFDTISNTFRPRSRHLCLLRKIFHFLLVI